MTEAQKGGVEKTPQTVIKNDADRNRSVSDHGFYGLGADDDYDECIIGEMLQPGVFHSITGSKGSGKTHLCVNLMYLLSIGFHGCGDWEIITNVFMYRKDKTGTRVCTPDHVHHVDSIDGLFLKLTELYGRGRQVAVVLDDIQNFYSGDGKDVITKQIRKLIVNRNKLRILPIMLSKNGFLEFESDRGGSDYRSDCDWCRYETKAIWENSRKDHGFDSRWERLDANEVSLPNGEWINVFLSVTDWTDADREEGWFFDRDTQSSVLRYDKAFDFDAFWKGLGNISSIEVTDYVHRFAEEHPFVVDTEKSQKVKTYAEIAVNLKSMGLTDEAIEYALKTPATTLRRWSEKQGYEWRKRPTDQPFQFKRVRDGRQVAGQAE